MEKVISSQTGHPQTGHPQPWLAAYLHRRARLASHKSDFRCDSACSRPGCKSRDLQVPVSLVDLLATASHRDESVSATFQESYSLGLLATEQEDWIRIVTLRLIKPCPFLANDLCSIYPIRPLPCILFPEYLVPAGTFEANGREEHFQDYLCFRHPITLSPERARVIGQLRNLWERESLISNFYLFNHGRIHLDFSNLIQDLESEARSLAERDAKARPEAPRIIPNRVMEHFFLGHMARCRPFSGVRERLQHLHTAEGQREFGQYLQDERLWKKLRINEDGRALVFRLVNGKLKAQRRSLSPPEYKFY